MRDGVKSSAHLGSEKVTYMNRFARGLSITVALALSGTLQKAQAATIDMASVGNPGNAADTQVMTDGTTGYGSVGYNYRIGKYEVTAGQYTEFLNAVAQADPNGLYNTAMGDPGGSIPDGPLGANIQRTGSSPTYTYDVAADWANRPVNWVSFWDAARFANWLHNGQPAGAQGAGTTEDGAYHDVGNQTLFGRNAAARFFIPTENEWYKAAYHDQTAGLAATYFDYPTGTNAVPGNDITETTNSGNNANYWLNGNLAIGSPYWRTVAGEFELSDSSYGTFDQGGNVYEWNETKVTSPSRGLRGYSFDGSGSTRLHASFRNGLYVPTGEFFDVGFRVASIIPEPSTLLLLCFGSLAALWRRRGIVCASILAAVFATFSADRAQAVSIDTVPVGNPGNASAMTSFGFGSVSYAYRIGKYEITNAEYVDFLNGVDPTGANTLALYNSSMESNVGGGINFDDGAANGSKYEIKSGRDNNPVVFVSWYDSIRFANWLHNGQGSGDTENGAYTLLGGTPTPTNIATIVRSAGAQWWLPSTNEWYKAAFHKNDGVTDNYWIYPTSTTNAPYSDQPPGSDAPDPSNTANFYQGDVTANGYNDGYAVTGSTSLVSSQNYLTDVGAYSLSDSPYGTFDQGGNVWEWNELIGGSGAARRIVGGAWSQSVSSLSGGMILTLPAAENGEIGFRVASNIPEPSTLLLLCFGSLAMLWRRRGLICGAVL